MTMTASLTSCLPHQAVTKISLNAPVLSRKNVTQDSLTSDENLTVLPIFSDYLQAKILSAISLNCRQIHVYMSSFNSSLNQLRKSNLVKEWHCGSLVTISMRCCFETAVCNELQKPPRSLKDAPD